MDHRRAMLGGAAVAAVALVACQGLLPQDGSALATYAWDERVFCLLAIPLIDGEPWRVTLEGDAAQRPAVWGVDAKGRKVLLEWPAGTTASFEPRLTVAWQGAPILHEGDVITSEWPDIGCGVSFRLA